MYLFIHYIHIFNNIFIFYFSHDLPPKVLNGNDALPSVLQTEKTRLSGKRKHRGKAEGNNPPAYARAKSLRNSWGQTYLALLLFVLGGRAAIPIVP